MSVGLPECCDAVQHWLIVVSIMEATGDWQVPGSMRVRIMTTSGHLVMFTAYSRLYLPAARRMGTR